MTAMFGFQITAGFALLIVGFAAEWLIKKRLQNKKGQKPLAYIAWTGAILGGTALSINLPELAGVTSAGATVVSCIGLMVIAVDLLWDGRPDWFAFGTVAIIPSFMQAAGGAFGKLFGVLLLVPQQFVLHAGTWFGF